MCVLNSRFLDGPTANVLEDGFESIDSFVFSKSEMDPMDPMRPQTQCNTIINLHREMSELKKEGEKKVVLGDDGDAPPREKRRKEVFCQSTLKNWNLLFSCVHSMTRFLESEPIWEEFRKYMEENVIEEPPAQVQNFNNEDLPI